MTDTPRDRLEALIRRLRADDQSAWHPLCLLVLQRAALPVARKYFPADADAEQAIAVHVIARLGGIVATFDPIRAGEGDGCAVFRRWAFNHAMELFGRRAKLPAAVRRLAAPDGEPPRPWVEALYRRCVLGGEPSHVVFAELLQSAAAGSDHGPPDEATLEEALVAIERALVAGRVAIRLAGRGLARPAGLDDVAAVGRRSVDEALDDALGRAIGRVLRALMNALDPPERFALERRAEGWSMARIGKEGPFKSTYYACRAWESGARCIRAGLERRFGAEVMQLVAIEGFPGVSDGAAELADESPSDPTVDHGARSGHGDAARGEM